MGEVPHISDDAEYERFDSDGLEQCPVCGRSLDSRFWSGVVYEAHGPGEGTEYSHLLETDPMDGPFYCGPCWREHRVQYLQATNRQLSDFVPEDRVYYGE